MNRILAKVALFIGMVFFFMPSVTHAILMGGSIGQIIFCHNNAIFASVGPPRGGPFIWNPSTRTYQFGPPSHTGQWLLGLAAPPYYCLVSTKPIIVWAGILMTMEGSSGSASGQGINPGSVGGSFGDAVGTVRGGTPDSPDGSTAAPHIDHLVVTEVYYRPDSTHGGGAEHQWIEIYNPTNSTVDLSHWTVQTVSSSQTIRDGITLAAGKYLILSGTELVRSLWTISESTQVMSFQSAFAGFTSTGDHVYLRNPAGDRVDAVSYGTDTTVFTPSVPVVQVGHSMIRKTLSSDSDTSSDWLDTSAPNPGR